MHQTSLTTAVTSSIVFASTDKRFNNIIENNVNITILPIVIDITICSFETAMLYLLIFQIMFKDYG